MQISQPSGPPPVVYPRVLTASGPARVAGLRPVAGSGAEAGDEAARRAFTRRVEAVAETAQSTPAAALYTTIDHPRDYLEAGSARRGRARTVEGTGAAGRDATAHAAPARRTSAAAGFARAMPAAVLQTMFEQMGGAANSVWKGMHVNLVV